MTDLVQRLYAAARLAIANERPALTRNGDMARDNVDLYRRVMELEERDRRRLRRIAELKLALAEAKAALEA